MHVEHIYALCPENPSQLGWQSDCSVGMAYSATASIKYTEWKVLNVTI